MHMRQNALGTVTVLYNTDWPFYLLRQYYLIRFQFTEFELENYPMNVFNRGPEVLKEV